VTDIITNKQAAETLGMKGRELGAFVKKHPQFAPKRVDGFPPIYSKALVEKIAEFRRGVEAGVICESCGQKLGQTPKAAPADSGGEVA